MSTRTLPIFLQEMAKKFPESKEKYAQMEKAIIHAESLKKMGVHISHRLSMKGEKLIQFLEKGIIPPDIEEMTRRVEAIENVMRQYLGPEQTKYTPPVRILLSWVDPAYSFKTDEGEMCDLELYHVYSPEKEIHREMVKLIFRRSAMSQEVQNENRQFNKKIEPIKKACALAQAKIGSSQYRVTEEVLEAMSQITTDSFDGEDAMICAKDFYTHKEGFIVKGVITTTNTYAGFDDANTSHNQDLANDLRENPQFVLERMLEEADLDPFDSDPTLTLVYQMAVNLRRMKIALGHVPLHATFDGRDIPLARFHEAFEKIPSNKRKTGHYLRALEFVLFEKYKTPLPETEQDEQEPTPKNDKKDTVTNERESAIAPQASQDDSRIAELSAAIDAMKEKEDATAMPTPTEPKISMPRAEREQSPIAASLPFAQSEQRKARTVDENVLKNEAGVSTPSAPTIPQAQEPIPARNVDVVPPIAAKAIARTTEDAPSKSASQREGRSVPRAAAYVAPAAAVNAAIPQAPVSEPPLDRYPDTRIASPSVRKMTKNDTPRMESIREKARIRATETPIEKDGGLLAYTQENRAALAGRVERYREKKEKQQLHAMLPEQIWDRVRAQDKKNIAHIQELEKTIHDLNERYGISLELTYRTELKILERKIKTGELKKGFELTILGNIDAVTKTVQTIQKALAWYAPDNPFDGQVFNIVWLDKHGPGLQGTASRESVTLRTGVDISTVHHELGHILDFQEGEGWEKLWYENTYEHAIGFKRYINHLVKEKMGVSSPGFSAEEGDEGMRAKRKMWLATLDENDMQALQYTCAGVRETVNVRDYLNDDGSFKGTPSEYALENSAEERAELWKEFTEKGAGMGGDPILQQRIKQMGNVLIEKNIVSKTWWTSKDARLA